MADYITKIRVDEGGTLVDKQIDYNALANLPEIITQEYLDSYFTTSADGTLVADAGKIA